MTSKPPPIPPSLRAALEETGLPWGVELGGRHWKLRVNGRLAGILPRSGVNESDPRALKNTIAQVRRCAAGRMDRLNG